jgi:hypothetical protein
MSEAYDEVDGGKASAGAGPLHNTQQVKLVRKDGHFERGNT